VKISFVSVITAGSDPTAPIGALTCVIGGKTTGWLTMQLDEFKEACEPYAAIAPLMTEERVSCLSKKWGRETLEDAINALAALHKAEGVDTVLWDDDVVSRISAFAFLWCQTSDRPALRRCEGEKFDYQASSLLSLSAPHARLNVFATKDRWAKCQGALAAIQCVMAGTPAPQIVNPILPPLPTAPKPEPVTPTYNNSSLPPLPGLSKLPKLPGQ